MSSKMAPDCFSFGNMRDALAEQAFASRSAPLAIALSNRGKMLIRVVGLLTILAVATSLLAQLDPPPNRNTVEARTITGRISDERIGSDIGSLSDARIRYARAAADLTVADNRRDLGEQGTYSVKRNTAFDEFVDTKKNWGWRD